jgi:hypothetical protein
VGAGALPAPTGVIPQALDSATVTDGSDAFDPATHDDVVAQIPDVGPADPADVVTPSDGLVDVRSSAAGKPG